MWTGVVVMFLTVVFENRVANGNALVADVSTWIVARGGDQLSDGVLTLMAKRTA
jgi:hypothetical protein